MLLYFCEVFYNKRLTLQVLLTPNSDIVISCDLFPSCSLVCRVSNMFRNCSRLSNIRSYTILIHKIGISLRFAALRNSSILIIRQRGNHVKCCYY